jgi:Amidohydrolase family
MRFIAHHRLRPFAWSVLTWALVATALPAARAGAKSEIYAFVDVNVISMKPGGKQLTRRQTVVVEDGEIVALGKSSKIAVPEGATVINGRKRYLLPGLWDMHAHGQDVPAVPDFDEKDLFTIYLANGITGVFDPWGFREIFRWQKDLERGKTLGPRLHFSSPGVDDRTHATADAVESSVRQWHRQGYQMIKVHSPITREKFERLHAVARELGLPVIGHALRPGGYPLQATLDQGQLMIAHIEEILATSVSSPSTYEADLAAPLRALVESRTWVTGTVGTYRIIAKTVDPATLEELFARPEMRYMPPLAKEIWRHQNRYLSDDFLQDPAVWMRALSVKLYIARRLRDLGALDRLLLGTDSGIPLLVPGFGIHDELQLLVEAGLTPWEALRTGTYNPAVFLGLTDEVGTVEVGKRADLLVVSKNPLRKIGSLESRVGVMRDGRWLPEAELRGRLEAIAARWESSGLN